VAQGATAGVLTVELCVAPVALALAAWARRWRLERSAEDVVAGALAALAALLGLFL